MPQRKAARVLPDPVGAEISVFAPEVINGQPCAWAGVGASKEASNQRLTGSENGVRGDSALCLERVANPLSLRSRPGIPGRRSSTPQPRARPYWRS